MAWVTSFGLFSSSILVTLLSDDKCLQSSNHIQDTHTYTNRAKSTDSRKLSQQVEMDTCAYTTHQRHRYILAKIYNLQCIALQSLTMTALSLSMVDSMWVLDRLYTCVFRIHYLIAILLALRLFHLWFISSNLRWIRAASSWLAPPLLPSSICLRIFLPVAVSAKKFSLSVSISNCRSWNKKVNHWREKSIQLPAGLPWQQ